MTTSPAHGGATPEKATEALVYVPGLALGLAPGKTAQGVVDRIARAMEGEGLASAKFSVQWHDAMFGEGSAGEPAATIQRADGAKSRPLVDVYVYDWATGLNDRWESQNLFTRAARTVLGLLGARKFIRFFNTAGKHTPFGRMQLALAVTAMAIVVAYAAILLVAVGQLAYQTIEAKQPPAPKDPVVVATVEATPGAVQGVESEDADSQDAGTAEGSKADKEEKSASLTLSQWLAILGSLGAAFVPKVRKRIIALGGGLSAASSYLRVAREKPTISRWPARRVS